MLVQSLLHSAVKYLFIYFVGQKVLQVVRSEYKIPSRYIFLIIEFKLPRKKEPQTHIMLLRDRN